MGEDNIGYIINRGDSLYRIAKEHQTTIDELMKLNRDIIENPDQIRAGEKINVPQIGTRLNPEYDSLRKDYMSNIQLKEGFKGYIYKDPYGIPTIGFGTKWTPEAAIRLGKIIGGKKVMNIKNGSDKLSRPEAMLLAGQSLAHYEKTSRSMVGDNIFKPLPLPLRQHMVRETRRGCWTKNVDRGSPKAIKAFINRDFKEFKFQMTEGRKEWRDALDRNARGIRNNINDFVQEAKEGWFDPEEKRFQEGYSELVKQAGLAKDPDDPLHQYDYRALFYNEGFDLSPGAHQISKHKKLGHPHLILPASQVFKDGLPEGIKSTDLIDTRDGTLADDKLIERNRYLTRGLLKKP